MDGRRLSRPSTHRQVIALESGTSPAALIDPNYKTPYALHATAGVQHAINANWTVSADYTHEQGNHGYRRYDYTPGFNVDANAPALAVFRSDNRSSFDSLAIVVQGNVSRDFNLIAHYTLSSAKTWGCLLGELFDYVNGVCDPLNPFAPGDYGPSGEDVRHRFVLAGTLHAPGGIRSLYPYAGRKRAPIHADHTGRAIAPSSTE